MEQLSVYALKGDICKLQPSRTIRTWREDLHFCPEMLIGFLYLELPWPSWTSRIYDARGLFRSSLPMKSSQRAGVVLVPRTSKAPHHTWFLRFFGRARTGIGEGYELSCEIYTIDNGLGDVEIPHWLSGGCEICSSGMSSIPM